MSQSLNQKIQAVIRPARPDKIDYIFLLMKWNRPHLINNLVRTLRALPIPVHLLPDENVSTFLSARAGSIGTTFTVELQRAPLSDLEQWIKRLFDIVTAAAMDFDAVTADAVGGLVGQAQLLRGPVLFKQKRNGFNGRVFAIEQIPFHARAGGRRPHQTGDAQ